jgi:carboxypeptidase C (cathepsin A)
MIGFIQEHGPCVFPEESDLEPMANVHAWTHNASIVYLETPMGVGYNDRLRSREIKYDDENVSYENLNAVNAFFEGFPELREKGFYLTGESYAGVYIPYLALRILEQNENSVEKVKLEGILIGNGITNYTFDGAPGLVQMAFAHGMIDLQLYDELQASDCDFDRFVTKAPECKRMQDELHTFMKYIYVYDIYRSTEESYNVKSGIDAQPREEDNSDLYSWEKAPGQINAVTAYMNSIEMKDALNVPHDRVWQECSGIDYTRLTKAS